MGLLEGFLYGVLGGFMAEVLGLFRLRQQAPKDLPLWLKSWFYWATTILMMATGGGLVDTYLRSGILVQPILAVNVGISAPLFIGSVLAQAPSIPPGTVN
jgi:hypothetical protein